MKHLKTFKLFESRIEDMEDIVKDILLELEDLGLQVEIDRIRKDREDTSSGRTHVFTDVFLEVRISRPWGAPDRYMPEASELPKHISQHTGSGFKYPGHLLFWFEVKDAIIRLNNWYYSQSISEPIDKETIYRVDKDKSPFRIYNSGIEFGIGWHKPEDFDGIGDYITSSSIRIEMKV